MRKTALAVAIIFTAFTIIPAYSNPGILHNGKKPSENLGYNHGFSPPGLLNRPSFKKPDKIKDAVHFLKKDVKEFVHQASKLIRSVSDFLTHGKSDKHRHHTADHSKKGDKNKHHKEKREFNGDPKKGYHRSENRYHSHRHSPSEAPDDPPVTPPDETPSDPPQDSPDDPPVTPPEDSPGDNPDDVPTVPPTETPDDPPVTPPDETPSEPPVEYEINLNDWPVANQFVSADGLQYTYFIPPEGSELTYDYVLLIQDPETNDFVEAESVSTAVTDEFPDLTGLTLVTSTQSADGSKIDTYLLLDSPTDNWSTATKRVKVFYDPFGSFIEAEIREIDSLSIDDLLLPSSIS
ncbi:MAG: DUF4779 domain-containing protein [Candidatus Omnitrophica bacterium]|nr:DUF4779 domain-containing protein [Candidatus Omnitrophota bacterium]